MNLSKTTLFIVLITISILASFPLVDSAYRKAFKIEEVGRTYILDFNFIVEDIGDYGVITVYMRPDGGYAYGLAIMKDPDEPKPHIYLIMGLQHQWYDLGLLNTSFVRGRIVVDTNSTLARVILPNYNKTFNLSYIPKPNTLYIALFNSTSREEDYPEIYIDHINVYVVNESLDQIKGLIGDLSSELTLTPTLNISQETMITTPSLKTYSPIIDATDVLWTLILTSLIILGLSIAAIIVIVNKFKTKTSPGP